MNGAEMSPFRTDVGSVWTDWTSLVRPRTTTVAGAAVAAGIATDLALRHGPPTISGAVLILVTAVGLAIAARPTNAQALACIAAAPLFGVWLVLRGTPWVLPVDVVCAGALLALGAAFSRGGSLLDLSLPQAILQTLRAAANTMLAPAYLFSGGREPGRRAAVVRGVLLALPLLIVVGALLASADAVFASAVRVHWTDVVFHLFAVSLGVWTMTALVRLASVGPAPAIEIARPNLGRTEWTIVLGSLDVLLAGFAVARIVALTQGGKHVIATAGLTYAEYARSGFFQLVAACVISLGALLVVRAIADSSRSRTGFLVLSEIAIALLLVVVVQAVQRLALYERAFGLTMPRLWATVICAWIGLSLVLLAVWIGGVGAGRHWFWTATGIGALAIVMVLNVVNVEAFVVHRNVAHAAASGKFDASELEELGNDAVPALAAAIPRLPASAREEARAWMCGTYPGKQGNLDYNVSLREAVGARAPLCPGGKR